MNIALIAKKVQAYRRDLFVAAPQIKLVDGDLPNPPVADASAIDEAFELNQSRLSWLYDHALFTVFPGSREGCGMHIAGSIPKGGVIFRVATFLA
jgi:hypothetical protein